MNQCPLNSRPLHRQRALLAAFALALSCAMADEPLKKASDIADTLSKKAIRKSLNASAKVKVDIHSIQFALDSAKVEGDGSYAQLRELARALEDPRLRNEKIEVQGHTCDLGDDSYNQALSQKRAEEVIRILNVQYGIPTDNLVPVGKGESEPLKTGSDEGTRSVNRRVTFEKK